MADFKHILYQKADDVGRITLNRPKYRNAQSWSFLGELDQAFRLGEQDDDVKVIVLGANGPSFSAGHDLGTPEALEEEAAAKTKPGVEGRYNREAEIYLGYCLRWRDIPKPTIAMVHGHCIAGGLMLAWPCDLIIAADDATFADPVLRMGAASVEYFAHPWELGFRKAKEFLFTGDPIDAQEAYRLGMVNRVVPRAKLEEETLALAGRIAKMPPFGLAMAKAAVNQTLDMMGQRNAMNAVFSIHHLTHAHNAETGSTAVTGTPEEKLKKMQGR